MIKSKIKTNIVYFYIIILFFFSVLFNQYYGNLGICPVDSFASFNAGYDILNGKYPFKDYWTVTGPFIALVQAFLFKLFGVSWFNYILHASLINSIFSILTFYILYKFKLNIHYCFFYSLLVSVLSYPSAGSPYVDHQSAILSIIAIYFFILGLKTNKSIYWFFLPIILFLSFLTKQAPTGHILIIITFLSFIFFIFNFSLKNILVVIASSLLVILIFVFTFLFANIPFDSFFLQYILYPLSLGENRLSFLFPLEFNQIILRHKLIHISSILLVIFCIKKLLNNYRAIYSKDILIILSLILSSWVLIGHQLMTINGIFIFFIIPILAAFSHIYYFQQLNSKKYILNFLLIFSLVSTIYYGYKYVHQRDFMDLRNTDLKNVADPKILSSKLKGLKWKSCLRPNDPNKEVSDISEIIQIIKQEKKEKSIITDYQFISVILSEYDNSPSQVWFHYHVIPVKNSSYYEKYKIFFIERFRENNVEVVYVVKPLFGGDKIIENVLEFDCYKKKEINDMLDRYEILDCKDLKN